MSPSSRDSFGTRLAPLRVHRDSRHIQKTSSSSSSSSSYSSNSSITTNQQRHPPVIIYTNSPKVIHAQARDFMALVQKLTGLSHSDEDDAGPYHPQPSIDDPSTVADSSSSTENSSVSLPPPPVALDSLPPPNPFVHEIPLFTTSSSADFFCPPVSFYGYPGASVLSPPNPSNGSSLLMEAMKPFTEY